MKILLDNCVHYGIKRFFARHEVLHARDMRWQRLENGDLIAAAAEADFEVFITSDKNIRHQHDLLALPLPVIQLNTRFNRFAELQSIAGSFETALAATSTCRFVSIGASGGIERVMS